MTVAEEISEIRKVLTEVHDSQLRSEGKCIACVDRVEEHHRTLYGNSHRGVKSKVDVMWAVFFWVGSLLGCGGGAVALVTGIIYVARHFL